MYNQKNSILSATNNGLDIFEYYIPELKQNGTRKNFKAIFRNDGENADAHVYINDKTQIWNYHDFVTGDTFNPFDFVMKLNGCDFKAALDIIRNDLNIIIQQALPKKHLPKNELVPFKIFPGSDISYWLNFAPEENIQQALNSFQVLPLESLVISKGGKDSHKNAEKNDPLFAFKISDDCYKIYRPNAKNKQSKHFWLGKKPIGYNNLFGFQQLPEYSDYILIVEGLKDAVVANANGITAVGVDNAATKISTADIDTLKRKCKHVVVCYDIDKPGQEAALEISSTHGLYRIKLPDSLLEEGGKDISDFFQKKHGAGEIKALIEKTISEPAPAAIGLKDKSVRLSKFEKVEKLISDNFELRFNEVSNEIEYKRKDVLESEFDILNENNIYRFLQHNNVEFSMAKLTALLRSDFVSRFNPFRDYFEKLLPWEQGKDTDYIAQLCSYLPVRDADRFMVQFLKALVRSVACALDDKIINKQALILVFEVQNTGKTTFIRWLCPPSLFKYIAENISTDKDSLIALCENFIINMDELATLSRAEINTLKSIFSKETIKVRRPYDKSATSAPRRANFFGSTNKTEFLTDETGSVRWLCFELTDKINWDYNKDLNIDDIWSQAYALYKSGFKYELTPEEICENDMANQQYQVTTLEIELIQKYYTPGSVNKHDTFYQATDFLNNLTDKCSNNRLNVINIGKALKVLGFERTTKRSEKYPVKGYYINYKETEA